jgi:hypothetical protein
LEPAQAKNGVREGEKGVFLLFCTPHVAPRARILAPVLLCPRRSLSHMPTHAPVPVAAGDELIIGRGRV